MNEVAINPRIAEKLLNLSLFSVIDLVICEQSTVVRVAQEKKLRKIPNQEFFDYFRQSRREEGQNMRIAKSNKGQSYRITEIETETTFTITPKPQALPCTCQDYENQKRRGLKYPCCAHGYKVLTSLGYTKFKDYLNA